MKQQCADMMDCHILSVAHNATITGPKCRVCAAFTIEMRQSVSTEILIISFPQGLRAAPQSGTEGDKCILAVPQMQKRVTVWFQHQSPNGFSKVNPRLTQGGEICASVCNSASFVYYSPWAKQANMAHGSHLIPPLETSR